jgi:hypothetical protein
LALQESSDNLEKLYAMKPLSVIRAIVDTSDQKLRTFVDSFRLKG